MAQSAKQCKQTERNKPKPEMMRGALVRNAFRNIYTALGLSVVVGTIFYFTVVRRRRNMYTDFYAQYDAEKSFKRMMDGGYLNSCPPGSDDESGKGKK